VTDIVATRSAGNYVEFHLADGRKPLMRTTLAGIEEQLKPHGFLRTHRSWLVNPLRVRGMTAAGSGDWTIELDSGVEALLSRRFPQALSALRSSELVV
jgi:DNA-binding LytR/AlgR family response regulator